jgi:hypothetical protein
MVMVSARLTLDWRLSYRIEKALIICSRHNFELKKG